jgi:hypothetical protein
LYLSFNKLVVEAFMKRLFLAAALVSTLSACATPNYNDEGVRATQAMTDMDGKPIYPGYSGVAPGVGIGIGIGSWGHRGGAGVGFGMGW